MGIRNTITYIIAILAAIFLCLGGGHILPGSAFCITIWADNNEKIPDDYDYENETWDEAYHRAAFFAGNPDHLVFATPVEFGNSTPVKILWLGNSIINRYEMAWQFANLCEKNGVKIDVKVFAEDENSLEEHRNDDVVISELKNGNYDFVLMQEESHEIRWDPDNTAQMIEDMMNMAPDTTRFYLYEPMAYSGQSENQPQIHDLYAQVGAACGAQVLYIGDAFQKVIRANPDQVMYDNLQHPSNFGYSQVIRLLYEMWGSDLADKYGALNPGSITFKDYGFDNLKNLSGALYLVKDENDNEVGAFLTDFDGTGYVAEKSLYGEGSILYFGDNGSHTRQYNGYVYTRATDAELELPSRKLYTIEQVLPARNGAYLCDDSAAVNGRSYKVDERETTPVMHWPERNDNYLRLSAYRLNLKAWQPEKLEFYLQGHDNITITSSNPDVIRVTQDGLILATRPGRAMITVNADNGITRKCLVNIEVGLAMYNALALDY